MQIGLDPALLFREAGYEPDPWQVGAMRCEGDRVAILAARQVGKSITTAFKAIHRAVFFDRSLILLVAPAERQSLELLRKVTENYHRLGDPVPVARELATTLELANSSRIIALPGDPLTIRCFSGVSMVIVDEAAMVAGDGLFTAVMPMLATSRGTFWMLSTPMGKRGYFHDAWTGGGPAWTRITAKATDCPRIDPSFLVEQRRTLGERWYGQEYNCVFVDTLGQVFTEEMIAGMFGEHDAPILEGF
jgi:hypothetical protein